MDMERMPEGGYRGDLVRLRAKNLGDVEPGHELIQRHGALLDGRGEHDSQVLSREEIAQLWHPWLQPTALGTQYQLTIEEIDSRAFRGSFVVRCGGPGQSAEVGYWVDPDHWGRGLGGEALRLAQWWAFSHVGASALTARVQSDNDRSRRLLERMGFENLGPLSGQAHGLLAYHLPRFRWPDRDGAWMPAAG